MDVSEKGFIVITLSGKYYVSIVSMTMHFRPKKPVNTHSVVKLKIVNGELATVTAHNEWRPLNKVFQLAYNKWIDKILEKEILGG